MEKLSTGAASGWCRPGERERWIFQKRQCHHRQDSGGTTNPDQVVCCQTQPVHASRRTPPKNALSRLRCHSLGSPICARTRNNGRFCRILAGIEQFFSGLKAKKKAT